MFHLTGPLSGGQFCQLSSFLPYMQPFVGGVLKAGGKSTEQLCTTIPPLQLLSKTNSPVELQFTQLCFCLRNNTVSACTGQIRKNYCPTSIPGEAFCVYLFPGIMHDNSRIHSSKAPAVIPWKELYLTWIGHSIFQQALLRI